MLSADQIASLQTELSTDPKALGYAQHAGNDAEMAGMLNSLTGPGAETIQISWLNHDDFANLIAPAVMALGGSSALRDKWTPMLNLISGTQRVLLSPRNLGLLDGLVTDGLMAQADVTAGTTRVGSRAEVLYGFGATVEWQDIARAEGRL